MLELGWQPSEVYFGPVGDRVDGLQAWHDLFLTELTKRFAGGVPQGIDALQTAMKSLDHGKRYVFEGHRWLEEKLFGSAPAN